RGRRAPLPRRGRHHPGRTAGHFAPRRRSTRRCGQAAVSGLRSRWCHALNAGLDAHQRPPPAVPPPAVLPGLREASPEVLTDVSPHEQGHKDSDRGTIEAGGYLKQAILDPLRIELAVELLVHEVRDVVQLRVDFGLV